MNINETTSFNAVITAKDANNNDVQVAYLNAALNGEAQSFNINVSVNNKALLVSNAADAQAQYSAFETAVKNRAIELGYVIF